jgi:hypothetical protein
MDMHFSLDISKDQSIFLLDIAEETCFSVRGAIVKHFAE